MRGISGPTDDTRNLVAPIGWKPKMKPIRYSYLSSNNNNNNDSSSSFTFPSSSSAAALATSSSSSSSSSPSNALKAIALTLLWGSALIGIVAIVIVGVFLSGSERHGPVFLVGTVFTVPACSLSFLLIWRHLNNFVSPLQRYVVRILWMVPIYSINSCLALMYSDPTPYLATCREFYEAYVVYNFLRMLEEFLGGDGRILLLLEAREPPPHLFPFRLIFPRWDQSIFLARCHLGVLQFVAVRCLCALVTLIIHTGFKLFSYGNFGASSAYLYLVAISNASQAFALYCLILFYLALSVELSPLRPILKFACVKFIVFMTFWQAVLLAALVQAGVVPPLLSFSSSEVALGLQNLLVCLEMFVASVIHHFAFPVSDFVGNPSIDQSFIPSPFQAFLHTTDPRDFADDVVKTHSNWRIERRGGGGRSGFSPSSPDEEEEEDEEKGGGAELKRINNNNKSSNNNNNDVSELKRRNNNNNEEEEDNENGDDVDLSRDEVNGAGVGLFRFAKNRVEDDIQPQVDGEEEESL